MIKIVDWGTKNVCDNIKWSFSEISSQYWHNAHVNDFLWTLKNGTNSRENEDEENLFYFKQETREKWRWILVDGNWRRIFDLKSFTLSQYDINFVTSQICLFNTTWLTRSHYKFYSNMLEAFSTIPWASF